MLVDYAYPTMMAEKCLKGVHDAFLDKNIKKAQEKADEAVKWIMEIKIALRQEEDASA